MFVFFLNSKDDCLELKTYSPEIPNKDFLL